MRYLMQETVNGDHKPDREVDATFVLNFTSGATRAFFEGLGGGEVLRKNRDGTIFVKAVSPDESIVRVVLFTPIQGGGDDDE